VSESAQSNPTVRFGRRPQRGLLLGFSAARVCCVAIATAIFTPSLFVAGIPGVAVTGPLWVGMLALAFVPWGGRPAIDTVPTAGHFLFRTVTGQTKYRARPSSPRPAGTLALPGDGAALRFHVVEGFSAVMLHDPHAQTLTAVAHVRHPAFVLLSPDEQARRVNGWGRALAGLAASGTCARIQLLEVALPDSGQGITGWWATHGTKDHGQWAVWQYEELMRTCAPTASTHRTLIALALDMKKANRAIRDAGRGIRGAAAVLRQEMTAFESGLQAAELQLACWLDEGELASALRATYDPVPQGLLDKGGPGRHLETAGPVAVDEHWDHLRHDNGYSAVLWISEWPRIEVASFFLHALVFAPGIRKTLSITATPLSTAQAMRDIRKAKVEYVTDSAQKARIGSLADLSDAKELSDVLDRESALISGHADIRFTGLVAVTANTKDELDSALSQVERAATQSGCETRRLFGQQARAFTAAALPLARKVG
jgi:hypothetical protein